MLIFGCGYLGGRVAKKAVFSGQNVWATTRNGEKAAELRSSGIQPLIADWTDPQTLGRLPPVDRILIAVSYDRHSDHSRYESQVGGLRNLLAVVAPQTHVCYISTTGVYHQTDGSWVDEDSPAQPDRDAGQAHLQAEELLREHRPGGPSTILRLAGIYGRGRLPRAADVVAGRPIASPEQGFINLIHVDDAASVIMAAWSRSKSGLYLVGDDCPVRRGDFYREIARQAGAPPPTFVPPDESNPAPGRSASNKRIRNDRMKRDLLTELQFPTYREGLAGSL